MFRKPTPKHTPGPWKGNLDGPLNEIFQGTISHDSHHDDEIAVTWGDTAEEAEANANLIAVAPEMFEALSSFVEYLEAANSRSVLMDAILVTSKKLIQKATE